MVMLDSGIVLDDLRLDAGRVLATTPGASLIDLDDGVLCLEFHSKGNTLDADTLEVAEHAFATIPGKHLGLVIGNQGKHFSFGANLRWLLHLLEEVAGDRERFRAAAKRFQRVTTGMRTAPFPTVAAPFGLTVGGSLEMSMYCMRMQPLADMRASLPEVAVGILPDLGGTSEVYRRCIEAAGEGNEPKALREAFETVVFMKASSNAEDARRLHFLLPHDRISDDPSRHLNDAKALALSLAQKFTPGKHVQTIPVLGDAAYAALDQGIALAVESGMASEYDATIARAIARVMTGGPGEPRTVSHETLLDLETEYFETLVFRPETRARMEHMLEQGTPLRN